MWWRAAVQSIHGHKPHLPLLPTSHSLISPLLPLPRHPDQGWWYPVVSPRTASGPCRWCRCHRTGTWAGQVAPPAPHGHQATWHLLTPEGSPSQCNKLSSLLLPAQSVFYWPLFASILTICNVGIMTVALSRGCGEDEMS